MTDFEEKLFDIFCLYLSLHGGKINKIEMRLEYFWLYVEKIFNYIYFFINLCPKIKIFIIIVTLKYS